jgi:hypothetical protein
VYPALMMGGQLFKLGRSTRRAVNDRAQNNKAAEPAEASVVATRILMLRCLKTSLFVTALLAGVAHADDAPPAATPQSSDTYKSYAGLGMFNDMLNLNLETVTPWGNIMLRAGRFKRINQGFAANVSWRKPLNGDPHVNDYYIGVFAGQVAGAYASGEAIERLGGGAEMGYHWVGDYTRAELTLGMGAAAPHDNAWGKKLTAEPTLFVSFSLALNIL